MDPTKSERRDMKRRPGRPPLLPEQRRQRVNLTLPPQVITMYRERAALQGLSLSQWIVRQLEQPDPAAGRCYRYCPYCGEPLDCK